MSEKQSFLRNYADTLTIIGVNLVIAVFVLNICLANIARINSINARLDSMQYMIHFLLKEIKKD